MYSDLNKWRKKMKKLSCFIALFILLAGFTVEVSAVQVTFRANTATVPDTLGAASLVQLRGAGGQLTWGGDSPYFLTNVGGDYWEGTFEFDPGTELQYKFYTNSMHDTVYSGAEWEHQGWEADVSTGNRLLTVGSTDEVLDLQFVNGWKGGAGQYETPYTSVAETFVVWIRVNMQGYEDLSPDADIVGLRGSNMSDWGQTGELSWGETYPLTREQNHPNGGSQQYPGGNFYSGAVHVPMQYATSGLSFKVVVHNAGSPMNDDWGNLKYNSQRQDEIATSGVDTTNYWFWFDNLKPMQVEHTDEVVVEYIVNMSQAITNKGFAFGDTVIVRTGYYGTAMATSEKMLTRMGFASTYTATDTVLTTIGGPLYYQYYRIKNGVEYREIYYNFYYEGETPGEAERRLVESVGGNAITVEDVLASQSEIHRMPLFRNTDLMAQDVLVTLTCDARPAIYQVMAGSMLEDIQSNVDVTTPQEVLDYGLAVNGPATGGWDSWGQTLMASAEHKMWDDGTHGDGVANDSVYTIQILFSPDSLDIVGQEFKFGIGGGDNEGGYGNNHIENIDDAQPTFTINAQFGSIDPIFYSAWDFDQKKPKELAPVMITFRANTATVPDTLGALSVVQLRGAGGQLTWGGDSPYLLTNVGGDYWEGTFEFEPGTELQYKFYTNAMHDTVYSGAEWEHQGWEADVSTGNRLLTVGSTDEVLDLQFVNGWKGGAEQYETPYTSVAETFVVWIRVNMQGYEDLSPDADIVGLRGSNMSDWGQTGELSWGETYPLTREQNHPNNDSQQYPGGNFYSGAVHVPMQYATSGLSFKVVVHNAGSPMNDDWGNLKYNSQRQDEIATSGVDTTNYWFWFDNLKPMQVEHTDEVVVEYIVNMSQAITNKGFAFGDTVIVRTGYYGTAMATSEKMLTRMGFASTYTATDTVLTTIGGPLYYQYYRIKNGVEYREIYYNFYYEGETPGEAERRLVESVGGNAITVEDVLASQSEIHRMPLFRNTDLMAQDVLVTLTCDARPAIYQVMAGSMLEDIQSNVDVTTPQEVLDYGLAVNGPATGGWDSWGQTLMASAEHKMWDDGTHGDGVANDSVYTIQILFSPDSLDIVGQEFKFGIGGGDNEGGYGNNHIENIDDAQPTFTINAQFGSIDPIFYSAWDFDTKMPTGVKQIAVEVPTTFALEQNYPNPFNPETRISFSVANTADVRLIVYDILGKEVVSLVSERMQPGYYQTTWDGRDRTGQLVGSGLYFYKLIAGDFVKTYKMMFMK